MDTLQTNTTVLSEACCVESHKLWRWYRDSLSGFKSPEYESQQYKHDLTIKEKGKEHTVRVPICKPENIGANMAIDEKQIEEEMHTIISNRDTGKIAVLAQTLKASELKLLTSQFKTKHFEVKTITRDLSPGFEWFCREAFMNAGSIADKFHITKNLLDASQDVRIRYRQEILRENRLKLEAHKEEEKKRKETSKQNGETFIKKDFIVKHRKLENGETPLELLSRTRYLLYKYPSQWTVSQSERAKILFDHYPQIEKAYRLACSFRTWYSSANINKYKVELEQGLKQWYNDVDNADIDEISNFKATVELNQAIIMRYFDDGQTNAIAENINSRIQRFIMINQGTRDREFFYFRMANYFS